MNYTIYNIETGAIAGYLSCEESQLAVNLQKGFRAVEGHFETISEPIRDADSNAARYRILELEKQQARRIREILAKDDDRLGAIDAEISMLRERLKG